MSIAQLKQAFVKCEKALIQLKIAVNTSMLPDDLNVDATIQRFEFSIELMWLLLKRILESQQKEVRFVKEVLQEAYKTHLIDDEKLWLAMLKGLNQTSHTYDQSLALHIYERIKEYCPVLQNTYDRLNKEFFPLLPD